MRYTFYRVSIVFLLLFCLSPLQTVFSKTSMVPSPKELNVVVTVCDQNWDTLLDGEVLVFVNGVRVSYKSIACASLHIMPIPGTKINISASKPGYKIVEDAQSKTVFVGKDLSDNSVLRAYILMAPIEQTKK